MPDLAPRFTDKDVLSARGAKNAVSPGIPYAFHVEDEFSANGVVEPVATLFLTNSECPFKCLMCDLWKNTLDERTPAGAVPAQIDYALSRLPAANHVKLYNSGNFFDRRAIPPDDYGAIAQLVSQFKTVIVENHPKLCNENCLAFRDMLKGKLEIALGLETIHPDVLPRLNKRMTLEEFDRSVDFLVQHGIQSRAFILLRPPYLDEEAGIEWALRSVAHAFEQGVSCCSVIPTRGGNGILDQLHQQGDFSPPAIESMETVMEAGLTLQKGRVFMDLWDVEQFYTCTRCGPLRKERLHTMNLTQRILPPVQCNTCTLQ